MTPKQIDDETAWHLERYLAMSSLFYLATDVLSYPDVKDESHKAVCDLIQASNVAVRKVARDRWALRQYDEVFREFGNGDSVGNGNGNGGYPPPSDYNHPHPQNSIGFSTPLNNNSNIKIQFS